MYISILIRSKNLNSLNNLLFFFTKVIFFHKKIRFLLIKQKTKKLFFKSFSVLQSPHVNKKSGEKFEFRVYCKKIIIYSLETKNLIFIIKQEIEKMYSDIWLTIYFYNQNKNKLQNFSLNFNFLFFQKTKKFIKFLDIFGENCFFFEKTKKKLV